MSRILPPEKVVFQQFPENADAPKRVRRPTGLPAYLASLYEVPLLTREQEVWLFRKFNYLKYKAATLREQLQPERPSGRLMDQIELLYQDIVDLKNKQARIHFELDQVNASLGVFENAYQKTFEEQKTEEK